MTINYGFFIKLALIGIGIISFKIGVFYFITWLNYQKYKQKNNKFNKTTPILNNTLNNSVSYIQRPIPRDAEVENKYTEVKIIFTNKMKNKQMNRDEILALRNYLDVNVSEYNKPKKAYKNDCHRIYSMLKAKDITLEHLNEIKDFLNSTDGVK